ncbi:hypothetical protein D3C81_1282240 [compost metagenome]
MICSRSRRAFSISSRRAGWSKGAQAVATRSARAISISSGSKVSSERVMPLALAVANAACTMASGSSAAISPLPSWATGMPPLAFSIRAWALSSSCLARRTKRLASESTVSSSRLPIATPRSRSFSATPGFFSSGRLSVLSDFSTPTASINTKRVFAPSALLLTRLRLSPSRLRTPRPFICS